MNILIADDDRIVRTLLRRILEKDERYEIREAESGADGWRILSEGFSPDICLFDIEMPEVTGLELLEKIRADERFQDLPVLFITSTTGPEAKSAAAALDAYAFIAKPFRPRQVLSLVHQALSSHGRVFCPYGFEERAVVMKRESLDAANYFEAMKHFTELLGIRLATIQRHLLDDRFDLLAGCLRPLKAAATQLGGTVFLEYFAALESLAANPAHEARRFGARHIRILVAEYQALSAALEVFLGVSVGRDLRKKIVTQPEARDWSEESIRLSAEIEECFFDPSGNFSLGSESILLRGFRGDQSVAMARMEVRDGRVVISALFDETNEMEVDLGRFSPHLAADNS